MDAKEEEAVMAAIRAALKKLRTDRGIGIEDFYNDTGIHIGRIETSSPGITIYTLHRICKYYNITVKEFFNTYC